ncbi:MAG: TPM domain-containing protein [Desulfuromonadaceae bacterium]|nr:TPM domain-containing protein [Desulfuromonadaceae bacterium]
MIPRAAHSFFTPAEQEKIRTAVARVEEQSHGEIVPVIIDQASSYSRTTACSAFLLTMALTSITLWIMPATEQMHLFWQLPVGCTLCFAIFYFMLEQLPGIKRMLLSPSEVERAMTAKAFEQFTRHGIYKTREQSGILILISLFEHRVEVLADEGINARVDPEEWHQVVDEIVAGLKHGDACTGVCNAIARCEALLVEHFPHTQASAAADTNELPNLIVSRPSF